MLHAQTLSKHSRVAEHRANNGRSPTWRSSEADVICNAVTRARSGGRKNEQRSLKAPAGAARGAGAALPLITLAVTRETPNVWRAPAIAARRAQTAAADNLLAAAKAPPPRAAPRVAPTYDAEQWRRGTTNHLRKIRRCFRQFLSRTGRATMVRSQPPKRYRKVRKTTNVLKFVFVVSVYLRQERWVNKKVARPTRRYRTALSELYRLRARPVCTRFKGIRACQQLNRTRSDAIRVNHKEMRRSATAAGGGGVTR
ncbi:hypothetical protein EVAR_84779_1 [Eumeta japonica]|uniref:Uncharacterized protein n=1 Tax=Eumeta variegata TaxID=151549 RepID=A0A4C1U867_EUMVA|nr:hypothetical protein EVAR_84779_1 [Eumeta japonica]